MKLGILMKQDLKNLITNPINILYCFLYPLCLILVFGFLFSNLYMGDPVSSYDYYGVSIMIYILVASSTITPNVFMEERIKSGNDRIAYAPVSRVTIYTSKILVTYLFMVVAYSLNLVILQWLGFVNYGGENFIFVYILFMLLLLFSVCMGGAICSKIKNQDLTNKMIGVVVNTLAICSGIFFPIASLGKWADQVSNISPIKWVLTKSFQIIYDNNFEFYGFILFGLGMLTLGCVFLIHKNYRLEEQQ